MALVGPLEILAMMVEAAMAAVAGLVLAALLAAGMRLAGEDAMMWVRVLVAKERTVRMAMAELVGTVVVDVVVEVSLVPKA